MPELKFFPETHVAYVSEVGPYGSSVQRGFKRLFDWLAAGNLHPTGPSIGIFYDDPAKVAPENLRCDLCAPVGPQVVGSGAVQTKEIGGWQVATTVYEGEENMAQAYREVYDWLREQGYHEADAPFEKYLSRLGERLKAEIGVPVIKQESAPGKQKVKKTPGKRAAAAKKEKAVTRKPGRKTAVEG